MNVYSAQPTTHFSALTEAESERLALLAEECAEVIQCVCKIQRHGYESVNPLVPDSPTNREELQVEVGHVVCALRMMFDARDVAEGAVNRSAERKAGGIKRWLHHQGSI